MRRKRRQERREGVNARAAQRMAGGVISADRTPVNPPAPTKLVMVTGPVPATDEDVAVMERLAEAAL